MAEKRCIRGTHICRDCPNCDMKRKRDELLQEKKEERPREKTNP
jgi:hypothetical protein